MPWSMMVKMKSTGINCCDMPHVSVTLCLLKQVRPSSGSLLRLTWSPDGTALAACGGDGSLVLAALLDVSVEDGRVVAVLETEKSVSVSDLMLETRERLDFREPVVKMSLGKHAANQLHQQRLVSDNLVRLIDGDGAANVRCQQYHNLQDHCASSLGPSDLLCMFNRLTSAFFMYVAGCNHLVVCTANQCHIFSTSNWNTPHIFDLKDPAQLVMLCGRGFAVLDACGAIQV